MSRPTPSRSSWPSSAAHLEPDLANQVGVPRWSGRANVVMVVPMSGEPNQNGEPSEPTAPADGELADSGVFPVEVEPPGPENELEARDAKIANLEKDKKENWDRYLRTA